MVSSQQHQTTWHLLMLPGGAPINETAKKLHQPIVVDMFNKFAKFESNLLLPPSTLSFPMFFSNPSVAIVLLCCFTQSIPSFDSPFPSLPFPYPFPFFLFPFHSPPFQLISTIANSSNTSKRVHTLLTNQRHIHTYTTHHSTPLYTRATKRQRHQRLSVIQSGRLKQTSWRH